MKCKIIYHFALLLLCFVGAFSEQWISLRNKTLQGKVCVDHLDKNKDLCEHRLVENGVYVYSKYDENEESEKDTRMCSCDEECKKYNDCCIDKHFGTENEINETKQWFCSEVPTLKYTANVYTIQSCLERHKNSDVEKMCLDEKNAGHISSTLVQSAKSKLFYKNYFCAVCNDDGDEITQWNSKITCTKNFNFSSIRTNEMRDYLNYKTYIPNLRQWRFKYNNESAMCSFSIEDFDTFKDLKEKFNLRQCVKVIDTCSQYEDPNCKAYSGYIYQRRRSVADPIVAYKNHACVLCNGVQKKQFTCDPPDPPSQHVVVGVSFSMLFDFNFAKGRLVGKDSRAKCRLIDGFVFDSITSQCVQMYCGKLFEINRRNGLCVRIEGSDSGMSSPCPKILVDRSEFDLLNNGSVRLHNDDESLIIDQYEVYSSKDGSIDQILVCARKRYLFSNTLSFSQLQHILSFVVLIISSICLILHLIVFTIVPKLRNEPGKCVASMAVALLLGNISFIVGTEMTPNYKQITSNQRGSTLCIVMAVVIHYSFLSATFWMNVMSFDVSATFKRTIRVAKCKFWSYSLYAWTAPAIIVTTSCLLDTLIEESNFKPMYGYTVCWISQRVPLAAFFVFPVMILLFMNYVFFGITIRGIKRSERQTKIIKHRRCKAEDSIRVYMYIKLAILMGLTWITGIIAALMDSELIWVCFIVLNGSQGSLLFFLFTCKRHVYEKVKQQSFSSGRSSEDSKTKSFSLSSQTVRRNTVNASTESLNSNRVVKMEPL